MNCSPTFIFLGGRLRLIDLSNRARITSESLSRISCDVHKNMKIMISPTHRKLKKKKTKVINFT